MLGLAERIGFRAPSIYTNTSPRQTGNASLQAFRADRRGILPAPHQLDKAGCVDVVGGRTQCAFPRWRVFLAARRGRLDIARQAAAGVTLRTSGLEPAMNAS
jgi:hypothetical protein